MRSRKQILAELAWLGATMLVSLVLAAIVLQLWDASLHIPFAGGGDGLAALVGFKGLIQHGWYFKNSSVGAPFGQELFDYSAFDADNLQWIGVRILAFGTSDPAALLNIYYVLGYPLVAGTTYAVLRALGFRRPTSAAGGVIFALLPFHFARGEGHLFLSSYFGIPACGWLIVRTMLGEPLIRRRAPGWRGLLTPTTIGTGLAVVLAAGCTLYYAVFTLLLLGAAALLRAVASRGWRAALPGLALACAVGVGLLVNISPGVVYRMEHGQDRAVAEREARESELYAGSLTRLVLPIPGHRIGALAKVRQDYEAGTPVGSESGTALGIVLTLGFLGLLVFLAARALRFDRPTAPRGRLAAAAAVGAALSFLLTTYGGVGALIANLVSPQIRAWNRLTPMIAFFALIAVAIALEEGARRLRPLRYGRALGPALAVVVVAVAFFDQTSPTFRPPYEATAASWNSDGRFVAQIEKALPDRAMVLQLPFLAFPETPGLVRMADYDPFRAYVHSTDLRWSYGAMKGRTGDWTAAASLEPLSTVLPGAVAGGFAGVYVDRWGYDDYGQAVERQLRRLLHVAGPEFVSEDGRLAYYDASRLAARLRSEYSAPQRKALSDAVLRPVPTFNGGGLGATETRGNQKWSWLGPSGTVTIDNDRHRPVRMVLSTRAASSTQTVLRIALPGRRPVVVRFPHQSQRLRLTFTAPEGTSTVRLQADGPDLSAADPRDLRVQMFDLRVEASTPRIAS